MKNHLDKLAYIFLLVGFAIGILSVVRLRYDNIGQFLVILLLSIFYLLWATTYHHLKGDMSQKLFSEYLLVALIAAVAAFLVFVR